MEFETKIRDRLAAVGVVGLGYVGLPIALRFSEAGFRVIGFDNDPAKIARLNAGESYIDYIGRDRVAAAVASDRFRATVDFHASADCDALILCLPTPLTEHREPDLSFVSRTLESLHPFLRAGQLISLESTTWPGTTEEIVVPRVESRGLVVGRDVFVVYSPERVDPGNGAYPFERIPKVVGGVTPACRAAGESLYGAVVERVVGVSSPRVAEMSKLLENIYRSVNIGLVNELKTVADKMGIDIHEVIDAAATKPFGFTAFRPGPGLGGHCVPIDPFYLTWKAREFGVHTRFIELAGEVNTRMPEWVAGKVADALNERGRAVKGAKVLVLGIAYKRNIDDPRESPAIELMELLRAKGAEVAYSDPHIPVFPRMRRYAFDLRSVELTERALAEMDVLVLATDHDGFDYDLIGRTAKVLVDTRGRYRDGRTNVVRA